MTADGGDKKALPDPLSTFKFQLTDPRIQAFLLGKFCIVLLHGSFEDLGIGDLTV
jgi:hypothetical protein